MKSCIFSLTLRGHVPGNSGNFMHIKIHHHMAPLLTIMRCLRMPWEAVSMASQCHNMCTFRETISDTDVVWPTSTYMTQAPTVSLGPDFPKLVPPNRIQMLSHQWCGFRTSQSDAPGWEWEGVDGPGRQTSRGLLNPPCPVDAAGSARKETSRSSAGRVKAPPHFFQFLHTPVPSPLYPPGLLTELMKVSDISTGLVHSWCSMFDGSIAIEITHNSAVFLMVNIFVCNKNNHNSDDNSYQWLIIHLFIHSTNSHWTPVTGWVPGLAVATANMVHHREAPCPQEYAQCHRPFTLSMWQHSLSDYTILNRKQL